MFREDVFFRINVIQIELPPLRERGTDILLLAQHFIEQFAIRTDKHVSGISNAAAEKLLDYAWPGNVRELRNAIERAVALTQYEKLIVEDLPEKIRFTVVRIWLSAVTLPNLFPWKRQRDVIYSMF